MAQDNPELVKKYLLPVLFGVNPSMSFEFIRSYKGLATSIPVTLKWSLVVMTSHMSLEVSDFGKSFATCWFHIALVQLDIRKIGIDAKLTWTMFFLLGLGQ